MIKVNKLGMIKLSENIFLSWIDREKYCMCDVKKYSQMYNDMKKLEPEDTLQLVMAAQDKEEKDFFELIGNFLLQQKQRKVIERNLF